MLDCSGSFLSKVENNKVRPSLAMLRRIVGALKINIASLFNETIREGTEQFNFLVRQIDLTTCPNVPTLAQPGPIDAFLAGGGYSANADRVAEEFIAAPRRQIPGSLSHERAFRHPQSHQVN